eukprot:TRINITY_DN3139_c0_g1_i1.p1 TRINITY_DN3139_c0_g1~~TRINITY_DN3139_c0_g1_i1.p1  ORF type:complete len:333 (+),score=50.60 TRINITY_DN3139_c0_g1_i1:41-1039(+)
MRVLFLSLFLSAVVGGSSQFLPDQVRACGVDANCQQYGDVNATCAKDSGLCLCGVAHGSYKSVVPSGAESHYYSCFKDSTQDVNAGEIVDLLLTIVFSDGSCTAEDEFKTAFQTLVQSILEPTKSTLISIAHTCTIQNIPDPPVTKRPTPVPTSTQAPVPGIGVYSSIRLSSRVSDLYTDALVNFEANLMKSIGFGSLAKLGDQISFYQIAESQSSTTRCPILWDGARVMAYFGNGASCRPAACKTGYNLEHLDGHCRLPATPPPSESSDDTLSKGAIAGIAVGSFVFVAAIVFIIYRLCIREPEIIIIEEETEEEEMVVGNAPDEDDEDFM